MKTLINCLLIGLFSLEVVSCQTYKPVQVLEESVLLKKIDDVWLSIDTSKFLFVKFDLKMEGICILNVDGLFNEKASFIITKLDLDGNNIRLLMKALNDDIIMEFRGEYDPSLDILVFETESFDYKFQFYRASKVNKILDSLKEA